MAACSNKDRHVRNLCNSSMRDANNLEFQAGRFYFP